MCEAFGPEAAMAAAPLPPWNGGPGASSSSQTRPRSPSVPGTEGTVAFRVCGERVEVQRAPLRCQHSLLATLIGSLTAVPIRQNDAGEIVVTSASSAPAFQLLAHFVTSDCAASVFERFGGAVLVGAPAHEALGALRLDAEYFLGSTSSDADFQDFKGALQRFAARHGASLGCLVCPQGMSWSMHSGLRPDVARLHQKLPPAPMWTTGRPGACKKASPPPVAPPQTPGVSRSQAVATPQRGRSGPGDGGACAGLLPLPAAAVLMARAMADTSPLGRGTVYPSPRTPSPDSGSEDDLSRGSSPVRGGPSAIAAAPERRYLFEERSSWERAAVAMAS